MLTCAFEAISLTATRSAILCTRSEMGAANDDGGDKESSGVNCATSTLGNAVMIATAQMQRLIGAPATT